MNTVNEQIKAHYQKDGIYEVILERLRGQGIDLDQVSRKDIAGVDEFHVRGAQVSQELANSIPLKGLKVLDMGSGLGGPCRMLADEYDCDTTGIDLSPEFVRTANKLSELVGLNHKTKFIQGSATELPFEDASFDVVWTQHVQMNVPDKEKFYGETFRVLKTGGYFLYYDIFKTGNGAISYPMPWATKEEYSFLVKKEEAKDILKNLGLQKQSINNQTSAGIAFFESLFAKIQVFGPPKVGLNLLMGETTLPKLSNLLQHLKNGLLELESGIYKKS